MGKHLSQTLWNSGALGAATCTSDVICSCHGATAHCCNVQAEHWAVSWLLYGHGLRDDDYGKQVQSVVCMAACSGAQSTVPKTQHCAGGYTLSSRPCTHCATQEVDGSYLAAVHLSTAPTAVVFPCSMHGPHPGSALQAHTSNQHMQVLPLVIRHTGREANGCPACRQHAS